MNIIKSEEPMDKCDAHPNPSLSTSMTTHHSYCRKEKSLGLLCVKSTPSLILFKFSPYFFSNNLFCANSFLSLYNRDGVESVELGDASRRLGVVRRRIYDVVNVMESIGVLVKKGKNVYSWKGFEGMHKKLNELKEAALKGNNFSSTSNNESGCDLSEALDACEDELYFDSSQGSGHNNSSNSDSLHNPSSSSKQVLAEIKREKSLVHLTENFVKLFLCSDNKLISLEEAAKVLLGGAHNPSQVSGNSKAKVRRLYDIANVLASVNLIEKTHQAVTRKPAFRWLGMNETPESGSLSFKKRAFGTEITNTLKRDRSAALLDGSIDQKTTKQLQIPCKDLTHEFEGKTLHQPEQLKNSSKGVVYGPFSPVGFCKDTRMKNVKKFTDWERLASSYRPQYLNQALGDIFAHYVEAWKSWYVEVTGEEPIHLL